MPPSKSQGTQPWWDVVYSGTNNWHILQFYDNDTKTTKLATKPGASFNFSIRVDNALSKDEYRPTDGQHGFGRTQYYSANYEYEEVEL